MAEIITILLLSLMAGAAMPIGALLAKFDLVHPSLLGDSWRHFIIAFGGGALMSAVALVLVPEGASKLPLVPAALCFAAGGICFYFLDAYLKKLNSSVGQLVAMLSDFIPEAIALGAAFAVGEGTGLLLALLMILQNLPEGFNAYEELSSNAQLSSKKIILAFSGLALVGPISAATGYYVLAQYDVLMGALMLFASAGILYLVFQDIAPGSKLEHQGMPAIGAVAGFLLGLMGNMVLLAS
ncbi:ZIP zinc transporter family protein [Halomonas citrativorans]|uniref:ZIP zinc transporter family protein n=1 Tax=Halomonas citrativorans TaxID=2742612 RepID=A0A1R4HQ39_9GAMM|nr:divalent cation transporter [Halomonas citrativorans]SJN09665.1 ZIP zinc transporter family protein [Halomonas citrativorans]